MFVCTALVACALVSQGPGPQVRPHSDLNQSMRSLEVSSDALCHVFPVAHSRAGRELLALRLGSPDAAADRPAILIVANLEGPQAYSSALALWEAEELLRRHASGDEAVRTLLETTTLYFVPRADPDAAERGLSGVRMEQRGNGYGVDNDRDGRLGENGPSDIDGDRAVTWMRVPDEEGTWIEDPTDARVMIEADPIKGQRGRWKLFPEGLDSDGDELVGEDPAADTELNHNFAQDWEDHTARAGLFPMDEPEARGLAEFMLAHKDIALVLCYGELDNLVEAPATAAEAAPTVKRIPAAGMIASDAERLAELSKRYERLVGLRFEGSGEEAGSFQAWAYHQRGLLTLSIRPWDIPLDAEKAGPRGPEEKAGQDEHAADEAPAEPEGKSSPRDEAPEPSEDAKRLIWIDAEDPDGGRFLPWTGFDHPQLGAVEIGGFSVHARTSPPDDQRLAIGEEQLSFLLTLGADLPRVSLPEFTATLLGQGLVEVEASVEVTGRLPLQAAAALRARVVRPARVTLVTPEGAKIVAGKRREFVSDLGPGERARFRWLVRAPAGSEIGITVDTDNAGSARAKAEVNQ